MSASRHWKADDMEVESHGEETQVEQPEMWQQKVNGADVCAEVAMSSA